MKFVRSLIALLMSCILGLSVIPALAAEEEIEPAVINGGVSSERAVVIGKALFGYPLSMEKAGQQLWLCFDADVTGTYYVNLSCVSSDSYRYLSYKFYDTRMDILESGEIQSDRLHMFDLIEGDRVYITYTSGAISNPMISICRDGLHLSSEKDYLTKPVTCCEDGLRSSKCRLCAQLFNPTVIPAPGHDLGSWGSYPAATCATDGKFGQLCLTCGEVVNAIVMPKLGHNAGEPVIVLQPTERQQGLQIVSCDDCGAVIESYILDPLG